MTNLLNISETFAELVERVAKQRHTSPESVREEWLSNLLYEAPIELLNDEQVLALADVMMSQTQVDKLDALLEIQKDSQLNDAQQAEYDALMETYNQLLLRKAEAIAVAVERGLRQGFQEA